MDARKLFRVLVIGGALLGAACEEDDRSRPTRGADGGEPPHDATRSVADAASGADAAEVRSDTGLRDTGIDPDATAARDDAGLEECGFCPNDFCCVDDGMGGTRTRDGFVCCWSTSC